MKDNECRLRSGILFDALRISGGEGGRGGGKTRFYCCEIRFDLKCFKH